MKFRGFAVTALVACAVGWIGRSVFSDDAPANPKPNPEEESANFGQPGEEHARLKPFVGEWAVHGKFDGGDGKTVETESTSSMSMIMGDRYLVQDVKGSILGKPFEGRSIIGYDKGKKQWFSAWIDSMGTGIMVSEGTETEKGKSWTFKGSFVLPQGSIEERDVVTLVNDKEMKWESYMGNAEKPTMVLQGKRK